MQQSLTGEAMSSQRIEETIGENIVDNAKISTRNVDVFYGAAQAIKNSNPRIVVLRKGIPADPASQTR